MWPKQRGNWMLAVSALWIWGCTILQQPQNFTCMQMWFSLPGVYYIPGHGWGAWSAKYPGEIVVHPSQLKYTVRPALRPLLWETTCLERPRILGRQAYCFNVTDPVTKDYLSWETTFVRPMGWPFKTGFTVIGTPLLPNNAIYIRCVPWC